MTYTDKVDVILADVYSHNGLPHLVTEAPVTALVSSKVATKPEASMLVWHLRLGHIHPRKLVTMAQQGVIVIIGNRQLHCVACLVAQAHQVHSRIPSVRPALVYHLVSVDVVTVREPSLTKDHYFTLFTEAKALEREVFFSSHKGSAAVDLKTYHKRRKNAGYTVVIYRLDGGREYGGNALLSYAAEEGIRLQITPPYTSTKNGRAEVSNHIVCTTARKMMIYANLPPGLWTEAVGAAVYILNLTPSEALGGDFPRNAVDTALGRTVNPAKPLLNTLRAYGATTIVYDEAVPRGSKMEPRGLRGQLVGYEDSMYRVWIPSQHKVKRTPHCQFVETGELAELPNTEPELPEEFEWHFEYNTIEPGGESLSTPNKLVMEMVDPDMLPEDDETFTPIQEDTLAQEDALNAVEAATEGDNLPELGQDARELSDDDDEHLGSLETPIDETLQRSSRTRTKTAKAIESEKQKTRKRAHYTLANMPNATVKALTAAMTTPEESGIIRPKTFKESQTLPEAKQWLAAAHKEIAMHNRAGTWRLGPRKNTGNRKVLRGRWVFDVKRGPDGKFSRFKARWVVRGFTQREGIDYDETYASVAKPVSLRVLFAMIADEDLECMQYDLIAAFLNALVGTHVIFVEQPHGFEDGEDNVCMLLKALYGLKQSPLLWYDEFAKFMKNHGFNPFLSDACVFRNTETGVIIVVYVDDILIMARLLASIFDVAKTISATFPMRPLGELHYYLGMRIIRDRSRRQLMLVQDGYLDKITAKFNLTGPFQTGGAPLGKTMAAQLKAAPSDYTSTNKLKTEYQTLVGSGVWPACISRPDCSYEIGLLCRFLRNPTTFHRDAIHHVLRYMIATKNRGIMFQGGNGFILEGYADSSWADDVDTRRSTGGMVFMLAGAPVLFKSGRQSIVTLSSTEAEYVQLTLAAKEANYLAGLLEELKYTNVRPVTIYEDNQPAIDITNRAKTSSDGRTRHIDTRFRYIQQELAAGNVIIKWIGTNAQAADGLTKALDKIKHAEFIKQLGMTDCTIHIEKQNKALALLDGEEKPIY